MNASSWPMFLLRTLNGAEMAPATAFKKVGAAWKHTRVMDPGGCTEESPLSSGAHQAVSEQL